MIRSLWRYSHFILAVSSSIFVLLATLTGLVLAFEPIDTNLQAYRSEEVKALSVAEVIDTLRAVYDEVLELAVDANGFVKVAVISMEEELNGDFYIDPKNGKKIGDIPAKKPLFEFTTNLHRSLFLKTPGRIFVGVTSFLLCLIVISGLFLFLKRQKGIRHFFDRIVKEDSAQYYHVITGRWMLVPILIIAATGVYLSLWRFAVILNPEPKVKTITEELRSTPALATAEFPIFRQTSLMAVKKLEFPFSSDVEDPFILSTGNRQLKINQITGDVIEEAQYPATNYWAELSFNLHTGNGSIIWSCILALAAINILYFMYSGALISLRRFRSKLKNKYKAAEAEIVILVGSENGSTKSFGKILQKALLSLQQRVYIDELNHYQVYPNLKNLVILTSTYGEGDPPVNATHFLQAFTENPPSQAVNYAVVGFGSLAYPQFCQYALDVDAHLCTFPRCQAVDNPFLIHNKSYTSFQKWADKWGAKLGLHLELPPLETAKKGRTKRFHIEQKQRVEDSFDETFTLQLTATAQSFQSGDLLAITPPEDPVERLYSIAKLSDQRLLLSIKRHELGLCSNYLNRLPLGATIEARIDRNQHFHFPRKAPSVTLIANGTGMAPYLGMIREKKAKGFIDLYWGGRTQASYQLYKTWIEEALEQQMLQDFKMALSKEEWPYHYVQDIVKEVKDRLIDRLADGGVIMICGSVAMQNGVLEILQRACLTQKGIHLSTYLQKKQILMDCY